MSPALQTDSLLSGLPVSFDKRSLGKKKKRIKGRDRKYKVRDGGKKREQAQGWKRDRKQLKRKEKNIL